MGFPTPGYAHGSEQAVSSMLGYVYTCAFLYSSTDSLDEKRHGTTFEDVPLLRVFAENFGEAKLLYGIGFYCFLGTRSGGLGSILIDMIDRVKLS